MLNSRPGQPHASLTTRFNLRQGSEQQMFDHGLVAGRTDGDDRPGGRDGASRLQHRRPAQRMANEQLWPDIVGCQELSCLDQVRHVRGEIGVGKFPSLSPSPVKSKRNTAIPHRLAPC